MSDNDNYINTLDIVYTNVKKPHIYKIINLINKKYYYGVHNGNNTDSYLGSGKLLHQAYKKYGINNFKKEILLYFDTIEEAFEYEKIIVTAFFMVLIGDLISSFDQYAMVHSWFYTQMITGIVSQLTWLSMSFLFIAAESKRERIMIGISQALGASVGSSLMLKYIKPFFQNFFNLF